MASAAYERALEVVRALAPEERRRLVEELETAHRRETNSTEVVKHRQREMHWLSEHSREYIGQWVALDGDKLISHNEDLGKVFDEAQAQGVPSPFTAFMEDPDQPTMGGW